VDHILYIINLGDSIGVLIKKSFEVVKLNNEHTPNREDEAKRILENGCAILKKFKVFLTIKKKTCWCQRRTFRQPLLWGQKIHPFWVDCRAGNHQS
jgi:hypothetical protein